MPNKIVTICPKCNTVKVVKSNGKRRCPICDLANQRQRAKEKSEHIKAQRAAYYKKNRERYVAQCKAYYEANKEWFKKRKRSAYNGTGGTKEQRSAQKARYKSRLGYAKAIIKYTTGIAFAEIPDDLARIKLENLLLYRANREVKNAIKQQKKTSDRNGNGQRSAKVSC